VKKWSGLTELGRGDKLKSFTKTIKKLKEIKVLYSDILDLKEKILSVDDDRAKAAVMAAIDFKTKSGIHYTTYSKDGDKYLVLINTEDSSTICFKVELVNGGIHSEKFHPERMFEALTIE
jgi:uncharacterized UPF0160 family protein